MKKLMMSSMILLPLILLLILSLSTAAVSLTTYIYVESVEIVDSSETIYLQKESKDVVPEFKIETLVFPMRATNKEVIFTSENESIVSINSDGTIKGKAFGETYVKAESKENQTKFSRRKVVVTDDKIHKIIIQNKVKNLYVGEKYQLNCEVVPKEAKDATLVYSSSSPEVASISLSGIITTKTFGSTKITVSAKEDSKIKAEFVLRVKEKLINATIDGDSSMLLLEEPNAYFPKIVLNPIDAEADIKYLSSNDDVATVDNSGKITFSKEGNVTITANIDDKYQFQKEYCYMAGYIKEVTILAQDSYNFSDWKDKPLDIVINTLPKKINDENMSVNISNTNILYQDNDKKFYVKGGGEVTITINYKVSKTESKVVSKTLNIIRDAEDIEINVDGYKGKCFYTFEKVNQIGANIIPDDSTYNVSFTTETVGVTISDNNVVFSQGDYAEALITASTNNGKLTKQFKLIYVNADKIKTISVTKGVNNIDIVMPSAIYEQKIALMFYTKQNDINSVTVNDGISDVNVITINNIGTYNYKFNINEKEYADINLNVKREVESINNVLVTAVDGKDVINKNGVMYTSSKELLISYTMYPSNTTLTEATITVSGNCNYEDKLIFTSAGEANVKIVADSAEYELKVYSTFAHPDSSTNVIENKTLNKGETLLLNDIVTSISPSGADSKFITYESDSQCLEKTVDGFVAKCGGEGTIKVYIDTDKGKVVKNVKVKVLEQAESITLNKNYFVVNADSYNISSEDYLINPTTANSKTEMVITSNKGNVVGNKISYSGSGLVTVKLTLANGVNKDLFILFAGSQKVVDFNGAIEELEVNSTFIANIPKEDAKQFDGVSNLNGVSYNGGIFTVTKAVDNINDEFSASFVISGKTFKVKGINKTTSTTINIKDSDNIDADDNGYVTALTSLQLVSSTNSDATYKDIYYESSNKNIATVDSLGKVTFTNVGNVDIYAISKRYNNVKSKITLRSTLGYAESVMVNIAEINLDYDSNKQINLLNNIILFPTTASKEQNVKLNVDANIVDILGFDLTAKKGGSTFVNVLLKVNDTYQNKLTLPLKVERSATGISLDGELLTQDKTITIDSGLITFNALAYPEDATRNNNVITTITKGQEFAKISNGTLLFTEKNKPVDVTLTLGNNVCSYVITCTATEIVAIVNIDNAEVVAPVENEVYFYSPTKKAFMLPDNLFLQTGTFSSGYKYRATKSCVDKILVDGVYKKLVITENVSNIQNVFINDFDNSQNKVVTLQLGDVTHSTASSKLKLTVNSLSSYNSDGSLVEVKLNVRDKDIANIVDGYLVFNNAGLANIDAIITGKDYYGEYTCKYTFKVSSTCGMAVNYSVDCPTKLVDTYSFSLKDKINIIEPKFGEDNVNFTLTSNEVFTTSGLDVSVVSTGDGVLTVNSSSGKHNVAKVINIRVDENVDSIVFKHDKTNIVVDYTSTLTYQINPVCLADNFKPTLTTLTYGLVSGDAKVSSNGLVTFTKASTIASVSVTASSGATRNLTIVCVPSDVDIVDVTTQNTIVVNNNNKYVFDIIGKPLNEQIASDANLLVVNKQLSIVKFNHGGKYTYSINNTNINFVVTEEVEKIDVLTNNILTAKSSINLNKTLGPTIYPSTSFDNNGKITISYNLVKGDASIKDDVLTFKNKGVAQIEVKAGNKAVLVTIESTVGFVKSAEWNIKSFEKNINDTLTISQSDYTILPTDVSKDMYSFVVDNSVATVNGNTISFTSGGSSNIQLVYKISENESKTEVATLFVHNPVKSVDFTYNDKVVNKIVTNNNNYKLQYVVDDLGASPYKVAFIADKNASVSENGIVTFNQINSTTTITLTLTNSDGTSIKKQLQLTLTDKDIIVIDDASTVDTIELEVTDNKLIYAVPINLVDCTYEVVEGDAVSINSLGEISVVKGGKAKVKVNGSYQKVINVVVHKVTTSIVLNPIIKDNYLYTASSNIDLQTTLLPQDSNVNKVVEYQLNNNIATVENGKLVFTQKGEVEVDIIVKYKGANELRKIITVRSSLGTVDSFDIEDSNTALQQKYIFEDADSSYTFNIINVLPQDASITNYQVENTADLQVTKNENSFIVKSIERGAGSINVSIDGITKKISYEARLKIKNILVSMENKDITNNNAYLTMIDSLIMKVSIMPLNANNKNISISVDNGGVYDSSRNLLTLPKLAVYNINIKAEDSNVQFTFTIKKVDKLQSFDLVYRDTRGTSTINGVMNINPAHNEPSIHIKFDKLPSNLLGTINPKSVIVTCPANVNYLIKDNELQLNIPKHTDAAPVFKGNAIVQIGSAKVEISIYRDGITKIEIIDHDNSNDISYGLQQMRVFAKVSYYNGNKNYYDMPVKVEPLNKGLVPIFETSDPRVTVTYIDGKARINFGSFVGSSIDEIKQNIFNKTVTITVRDSSNTISSKYTFHVVNNGVNVFDQAGYTNNGQVVLHTNLGGTEEAGLAKYSPYEFASNSGKSLIYGNGFIVNFYAYNNTYTKSSGCVTTGVGTAINVNLKGGNFDASKGSYHNNFGGPYFAYTYIQQTYKGTYAGNGQIVKNCYFRYIKDMSIQISDSDKKVYVENIISIDGGNTALEYQKGAFYLKGFIDVYNFKDKRALRDFAVVGVNGLVKEIKNYGNGQYVDIVNNEVFVNVVMACGKQDKDFSIPVYCWDEATQTYVANEGTSSTATGLVRINKTIGGIIHLSLLTYKAGVHPMGGNFTYANQNNPAYLAQQEKKLTRTYNQNNN